MDSRRIGVDPKVPVDQRPDGPGVSRIDPSDPAAPQYQMLAKMRSPVTLRELMISPVRTGYIGQGDQIDPKELPPSAAQLYPRVAVANPRTQPTLRAASRPRTVPRSEATRPGLQSAARRGQFGTGDGQGTLVAVVRQLEVAAIDALDLFALRPHFGFRPAPLRGRRSYDGHWGVVGGGGNFEGFAGLSRSAPSKRRPVCVRASPTVPPLVLPNRKTPILLSGSKAM